MNEELKTDEQKTLEQLYDSVAQRIVRGERTITIITDIRAQGWDLDSALELVITVKKGLKSKDRG